MRLTKLEIDTILGMLGDVDPAHFEAWEEPERTRREKAFERAKEKLEKAKRCAPICAHRSRNDETQLAGTANALHRQL